MALTNNDIIKKLRVALKLRDEDIIEILALVDYKIGKSELGAFFRNEEHPKYVDLQDQILRNFLNGLVIYKRGTMEDRGKAAHEPSKDREKSTNDSTEKSTRKSSSENIIQSAQEKYGGKK